MLNGSLSGWPYSGPDIAGFFQGERPVDGSGEKALWIHWVQLEVYKGMNRVTVPAPFYQIRFFVREGVDLRLSSPGFENP